MKSAIEREQEEENRVRKEMEAQKLKDQEELKQMILEKKRQKFEAAQAAAAEAEKM